jgi:hypothetical protein
MGEHRSVKTTGGLLPYLYFLLYFNVILGRKKQVEQSVLDHFTPSTDTQQQAWEPIQHE